MTYRVAINKVVGSTDIDIVGLSFDSRSVTTGDCFVAIRGSEADGHRYIGSAVEKGAPAVVCEELPGDLADGVTYVEVADSNHALAVMAGNFYDSPSQKLKLTGITGTNGKTTVATLLCQLFENAGANTGLFSTIRIAYGGEEYTATHTTPDPVTINRHLADMVSDGVSHCFMEVSSHGIDQQRIAGLHFSGGVFTNLTHDHLDYHSSFEAYRDAKKKFFDQLPKDAFALVNVDDKNGLFMLQNTRAGKHTYALKNFSDYRAQVIENQFSGLMMKIDGKKEVWSQLTGRFNAYNLLAVYAVAHLLGMEDEEALRQLSKLKPVAGRFQYQVSDKDITVVVDYAHTPDALKNVLTTINHIRSGDRTLITVVGCGGDRDKAKRPKMGHIASTLSDKVIFTSDNPRTENPETIIQDMEQGVEEGNIKKLLSIPDRRQAIKAACQLAGSGDIVLIAGKGHEAYQVIGSEKKDFDDYKIAGQILKELDK